MIRRDILIVAHFTLLEGEPGNSRFDYLANMLCEKGHTVEIVTSSFYHIKKKHRKKIIDNHCSYKVTLIPEKGYKKNISVSRLLSHWDMSRRLRKYLKKRSIPDVIYCAVPSLSVGSVVVKYAKKNNIRFIIDVQDIWPEAFKLAYNIPIVSNIAFYPLKKKADSIYSFADEIIAVSDTYLKRAMSVNQGKAKGVSVFLGTDLNYFDRCKEKYLYNRDDNEFWIGYIGTLGSSYDLKVVIDAVDILYRKGIKNIRFIIMGDGPLRGEFEEHAGKFKTKCKFTGMLDYPHMVGLLCSCDIAVNPIVNGAAQSIINKVGDYAAAALPVINTQKCKEYEDLIEAWKCGFNCNDKNDIAKRIEELMSNKDLREKLAYNSRCLAKEKFDREKTYGSIADAVTGDEAPKN